MAKEEQPLEPAAARALHQVQVELDTRVSISTAPLRPLSTRCMCLDSLCTALMVSLCLGTALVSAQLWPLHSSGWPLPSSFHSHRWARPARGAAGPSVLDMHSSTCISSTGQIRSDLKVGRSDALELTADGVVFSTRRT